MSRLTAFALTFFFALFLCASAYGQRVPKKRVAETPTVPTTTPPATAKPPETGETPEPTEPPMTLRDLMNEVRVTRDAVLNYSAIKPVQELHRRMNGMHDMIERIGRLAILIFVLQLLILVTTIYLVVMARGIRVEQQRVATAETTTRIHGRPGTAGGGGPAAAGIVALLVVFSLSPPAMALSPADPPAARTPAVRAVRIVGITPDYVGQGRTGADEDHPAVDVTIVCAPRCPAATEDVEFSTSGLSVMDGSLWIDKAGRLRFKLGVANDAEVGYAFFKLVDEDGKPLAESPERVHLEVFTEEGATVISRVEQRPAMDSAARTLITAMFIAVHGDVEGKKMAQNFFRTGSQATAAGLLTAAYRKLMEDAARAALPDRKLGEIGFAKLAERVAKLEAGQALLGESVQYIVDNGQDLESAVSQIRGSVTALEGRVIKITEVTRALGGEVANLGDATVKRGGFLGFGGRKPLDPGARERVQTVLAKLD